VKLVRSWVVTIATAAVVLAACSSGDNTQGTTSSPAITGSAASTSSTVVVAAEVPPLDLSGNSYVANLLAKEMDDEWTRGEGLVATLELLAGETVGADVLRSGEVIDEESTGIIAIARDYLDGGPDEGARAEIERLLDLLVFSSDRLDAMAGIGPATAGLTEQVAAAAFQGAEQDCRLFFRDEIPAGVGQCLDVRTLHVLDVKGEGPFRVFVPAESLGPGGWTEHDYDLALEAMSETIPVFSKLDGVREVAMTPINLVFSVADDGYASADPLAGKDCGVVLHTALQTFTDVSFKQVVAHELAHCFQTEAFPPQNEVDYEYTQWREEGLAEFLGNVIYPKNDLEWHPIRMAKLEASELRTTLFDRAYTNFMFFQFLHGLGGFPAIFSVVDELPVENGYQLQKDALAGFEGVFEAYHEFLTAITDEKHEDTGGTFGPYPMTSTNRPIVEISGVGTVASARMEPFGVFRRRLIVPDGKQACLTWDETSVIVEKRANPPGEWAPLPILLPAGVEESGNVDLVVTATKPVDFALVVASLHDLDEEQDGTIIGEWVVDNASMRAKVGYIAPIQTLSGVSGQIRVTFRDDGTVRLVYSGFTVSGSSDVQLEDGAYSTDLQTTFRSVTDAEGVDGYHVSGDYVFYDSLFEEDFLNGTETVETTSRGYFFGIETSGYDIEFEEPKETLDEYPAGGWAFLGAANQLRFACGGEIMLLDDIVMRRAG